MWCGWVRLSWRPASHRRCQFSTKSLWLLDIIFLTVVYRRRIFPVIYYKVGQLEYSDFLSRLHILTVGHPKHARTCHSTSQTDYAMLRMLHSAGSSMWWLTLSLDWTVRVGGALGMCVYSLRWWFRCRCNMGNNLSSRQTYAIRAMRADTAEAGSSIEGSAKGLIVLCRLFHKQR